MIRKSTNCLEQNEYVFDLISEHFFFSLHSGHSLCSVSSKNIIAYTTVTELDDLTGKSWGSHLYVSDFNTLWHGHK